MDFSGISPQAFERLAQAICAKVIGPDVVIFGKGRDGGREATFYGPNTGFPEWDGYCVVQAKCREGLKKDSSDATWLAGQLSADLQKFVDNPDLPPPSNYLLISNVALSSVPEVGGKAKIDAVFESFADQLGLVRWHTWGSDELRALLEGQEDIRRAYAAWITPSDILSEVMDRLIGTDLRQLLPIAIAKQLRSDRDVRLRDAGQETEQSIYLEQVFIDLPVNRPDDLPGREPVDGEPDPAIDYDDDDDDDEETEELGCVAAVLRRADDKLDPSAIIADGGRRGPHRNHIVILGGPGQGKSTLGQFVAQVARARLLATLPRTAITSATNDAIKSILRIAEKLGMSSSGPARFPVRVELPQFADAIESAPDRQLSLLAFIAKRFSLDLGGEITVVQVRQLLAEVPFLLVLDGLDEVPPSANRKAIIEEINAVWDEAHAANSDLLVVVSTRPQGYNHDLPPKMWEHWELKLLGADTAIGYAKNLAQVRLSDPNRRDAIIADIARACSDASTNFLTTTPLQVAILFGISFLKGNIPQDRWELFDRYYSLLRDREAQKLIPTAAFVRDNKRLIDAVHHQCGWLLQVKAEKSGRTNAYLTGDQFTDIIKSLLEEEEFDDATAAVMAEQFSKIATDRLVLLASRTEGQIAFDVRSLQEYMAAAKLTSSTHTVIETRLRAIAVSSHWRNVFRIAASKIFSLSDFGHLRPMIIAICDALDAGDLDEHAIQVKAGSMLAHEMLSDGIATNSPKFRRQLIVRAMGLLDLGERVKAVMLSVFADAGTLDLFRKRILDDLTADRSFSKSATFTLLLTLCKKGLLEHSLVGELAPRNPIAVIEYFSAAGPVFWPPQSADLIVSAQLEAGPAHSAEFLYSVLDDHELRIAEDFFVMDASEIVVSSRGPDTYNIKWFFGGISSIETVTRHRGDFDPNADVSGLPEWGAVHASRIFRKRQNSDGLVEALEHYTSAAGKVSQPLFSEINMPWPLWSAIAEIEEGTSAEVVLERARSGEFGGDEEWRSAEQRWRGNFVAPEDVLEWGSGWYLSKGIGEKGAPPFKKSGRLRQRRGTDITPVLSIAEQITDLRKRERLFWMMSTAARPGDFRLVIDFFLGLQAQIDLRQATYNALFGNGAFWADDRVVALANDLAGGKSRHHARFEDIAAAHARFPEKRGLIIWIALNLPVSPSGEAVGIQEIHPSAFESSSSDNIGIAGAVAYLKLVRADLVEEQIPQIITAIQDSAVPGLARRSVQLACRNLRIPSQYRLQVLSEFRRSGVGGTGSSRNINDAVRVEIAARSTDLDVAEKARSLELPTPA